MQPNNSLTRDKIKWKEVSEYVGFVPHIGQVPIIEAYLNGKREIVWVSGRRSGKSQSLGFIGTLECLMPNRKIWIVAPDYGLTEKVFTYLLQYVAKIFPEGTYHISSKPGMNIRFDNGTIIECKSGDNPNSLLGDELDLLIIDEAAMMSPNVYDRYLFATTAMRKGTTIFISTPQRKNWFFRKYGEIKGKEDGFVYNTPSAINPYLPTEEIERAKRSLPTDIFKQEYEAQFLDTGAGVFRGFDDCKIAHYKEEPKGSHRYIMGVDIAKVNDFTVITVIDKQTNSVVYWERFNGLEWPLITAKIVNVARKYNHAKVIIDSTGVGNPVSDTIRRELGTTPEDFKFAAKSKKDLIDKLSIFIENKSITIPDEIELLDELDCYACEMTEGGTLKYGAPIGKHDDCVMSLGLAVWGLTSMNKKPLADDLFKVELKNMLLEDIPVHRTHR
jgi:hypothetical protein